MKVLRFIGKFLTSHYSRLQLLFIVVVIVCGFFLGDSSIFKRFALDRRIMQLHNQIDRYDQQIQEDQQKMEMLSSDKDQIEKYAREKYYMKKPNEDVFIIK